MASSNDIRATFLDSRAAIEMAPEVARLMGAELGWDDGKVQREITAFEALARGYLVETEHPL